jgi:glucosylceramidase
MAQSHLPVVVHRIFDIAILVAASLWGVAAHAQEAAIVVSSRAGDRLAAKPSVRFRPQAQEGGVVFQIDPAKTHQSIVGFGASILEAGMICINSLPAQQQEQVLQSIFDPARGAGFSAMKTTIACTDFMSAGPWYTYNDTSGDVAMRNFSIERDLKPDGSATFIKRARKHGTFVLQASMDYPPDWMLTQVQDRRNQDVQEKHFDALALYYLRYLQEYQKAGIFIDYLCLFNEPGVYTKIPYTKIRDLIKNHVGPLLAQEGIKTRIMLSEAPTREQAARNYPVVLDDPEARKYIGAMPYHGYDFRSFDKIAALHERYPDIPLWMTEVCYAYQAGTPKTMKLPRPDFEDGDFWGNQIFSDLEAGAAAWIYWNMILDENGGPWAVSPVHGNPEDNIQHPLAIINRKNHEVIYTGAFYYLAHFAKFVRPGAVRVEVKGTNRTPVRCIAFQTADGQMIAQLINSWDKEAAARLDVQGQSLQLNLPAGSITTAMWKKR